MRRKIVHIDTEKCDGCGLCAEACVEGAIAIIDGKARLVSESYCDGLGACIVECPQGAITILEREAAPFDEEAVRRHLAGPREDGELASSLARRLGSEGSRTPVDVASTVHEAIGGEGGGDDLPCGCPVTVVRELKPVAQEKGSEEQGGSRITSRLCNWPVQLRLLPITAPYLRGAHLLLAADCTAFAFPEFHHELLEGKVLLVGCPKLDDASFYREKLAAIITENEIREITVVHMEVPCCFGLANIARRAIEDAGAKVDLTVTMLGVHGDVLSTEKVEILPGEGVTY